MRLHNKAFLALVFFNISIIACNSPDVVKINGSVDYIGDAEIYIKEEPLHYKYSPSIIHEIESRDGNFELSFQPDSSGIVNFYIQDNSYPLYLEPGNEYSIKINRADFPKSVEVSGPETDWNTNYQDYLRETEGLQAAIDLEMNKFQNGIQNNSLELGRNKVEIAEKHLSDTKLTNLYLKTIGEYLVLKLRAVEYTKRFNPTFDADKARQNIINEAKSYNFFSLSSLKAQRAGIRDFTHYWSRTFGIYDSLITDYGEPLAEYDIKSLAYKELNKKRIQVLDFIEDRKAKAYAELFLVAERIGEQPIEIYEPSYKAYLEKYPEYEKYTDFLTYFYNEIKSVSPGQPAVPFSLPDQNGDIHTMSDYEGSFVLLDFWAGWCQPCLEEFSDMREIYSKYSRDELEILGISNEVDSLIWVQDIKRFKNPWPQLYGGDGFDQETFKAYKGGGIPFYILVDPDGKIIRYNDIRPSFNFTEVLDSLLLKY